MTSSRFLTFLERAAFVETFDLDRQIGAGVIYARDPVDNGLGWGYTLSAGIFGPQPEFDEDVAGRRQDRGGPGDGRADRPRGQRRAPGPAFRRKLA